MKKLFAQVLISLLALGCMACTACTTTEQPPAPPPKPALPYKINLVWQHDHKPEVDLSTLDKVPGVNVVSPCWYEIENEYGKIKDKSVEGYVERAHARGYQVWPLITNGFKPDRTKKLLDDENAKRFVIEQLRQQYQKHKFDGINLDFENIYEADKDRITEFVKQIRKATQQDKLILSMDVTVPKGSPNWSLCFDRKALAEHLDYMMLWHYDNDNKRFYAKTLSMPGSEKLIAEKSSDETFRCRWLEKEKVTYYSYVENDVPYSFWQENKTSLAHKAGLLKQYNLAGIATWRYGFEKPEIWPMLEEKLKEAEPAEDKTSQPKETTENTDKSKNKKKKKKQS